MQAEEINVSFELYLFVIKFFIHVFAAVVLYIA